MCLAIPAKIITINGHDAEVEIGGITKQANLTFLTDPKIGDYVLLHAGFAIQSIDEKEALEVLKIWGEMNN